MRRQASIRVDSSYHDTSKRITLTLIVLILMFILLVSPSEIIHFYRDTVPRQEMQYFKLGIICTNILQAINFAFSFVLYCFVNATFRRTVTGWLTPMCGTALMQQEQLLVVDVPKPSQSSSSGSTQRRTYYCALKHSISAHNSLGSGRTLHNPWNETCI